MKRLFREAADIAKSVPMEFRQAAFDKAVDMLAQEEEFRKQPGLLAAGGPRETRVQVTGLAAPDAVIDRYVEALSYAANRLGLETVSADQLAAILNDRFGTPAPVSVVAAALGGAGAMVRTVRSGSKTLYKIVGEPVEARVIEATKRATTSKRAAPTAKKRSPAKKKTLKQDATPADILNDLVALGFFATARTTADVLIYLEKQGLEFTSRQLAPALLRLMRSGLLNRKDDGRGKYRYRAG
jgi:hypothetical protein